MTLIIKNKDDKVNKFGKNMNDHSSNSRKKFTKVEKNVKLSVKDLFLYLNGRSMGLV